MKKRIRIYRNMANDKNNTLYIYACIPRLRINNKLNTSNFPIGQRTRKDGREKLITTLPDMTLYIYIIIISVKQCRLYTCIIYYYIMINLFSLKMVFSNNVTLDASSFYTSRILELCISGARKNSIRFTLIENSLN